MLYVGTCVYLIEDTFGELSTGNTVWYFFLARQILGGLRLFSDFFFQCIESSQHKNPKS